MIKRVLLFLLILLSSRPLVRSASTEDFLWNQANASLARASTPEEFLSSALLYRSLLDRAVHRPKILENYGTALLLAEYPSEALDAFLRAERLAGHSPSLLHNIRVATLSLSQQKEGLSDPALSTLSPKDAQLPLSRTLLPWHYRLPLRHRTLLAASAWALFWLLFPARKKRVICLFLVLSAATFALFASSAALSFHENRAPLPAITPKG